MASEKNQTSSGVNKAVIVNMSSILGSITLNDQGGFYPYRTSKVNLLWYSIEYWLMLFNSGTSPSYYSVFLLSVIID